MGMCKSLKYMAGAHVQTSVDVMYLHFNDQVLFNCYFGKLNFASVKGIVWLVHCGSYSNLASTLVAAIYFCCHHCTHWVGKTENLPNLP